MASDVIMSRSAHTMSLTCCKKRLRSTMPSQHVDISRLSLTSQTQQVRPPSTHLPNSVQPRAVHHPLLLPAWCVPASGVGRSGWRPSRNRLKPNSQAVALPAMARGRRYVAWQCHGGTQAGVGHGQEGSMCESKYFLKSGAALLTTWKTKAKCRASLLSHQLEAHARARATYKSLLHSTHYFPIHYLVSGTYSGMTGDVDAGVTAGTMAMAKPSSSLELTEGEASPLGPTSAAAPPLLVLAPCT